MEREPVSMRIHNAILAAINATMRSNCEDEVSDEQFTQETLTALIPLCEHAAKMLHLEPSELVAMLALSLAHEKSPANPRAAVTSIITNSLFDAMTMIGGVAHAQTATTEPSP